MTKTTDLQAMINSCIHFAAYLKTGNITWKADNDFQHGFKCKVGDQSVYVFLVITKQTDHTTEKTYFQLVSSLIDGTILKSQTAKEACIEALELIKIEAQKMLNDLDPKQNTAFEETAAYVVNDMLTIIKGFVNEWVDSYDMSEDIESAKKEYTELFKSKFASNQNMPPLNTFIERLTRLTQSAPINNIHNKTLVEGYKYVLKIANEVLQEAQTA